MKSSLDVDELEIVLEEVVSPPESSPSPYTEAIMKRCGYQSVITDLTLLLGLHLELGSTREERRAPMEGTLSAVVQDHSRYGAAPLIIDLAGANLRIPAFLGQDGTL